MIFVVFNVIGLLITFVTIVTAALIQWLVNFLIHYGHPYRDDVSIIFFAWGLLAYGADLWFRLRRRDNKWKRLFFASTGGQLFFVPCWIWGVLTAGLGSMIFWHGEKFSPEDRMYGGMGVSLILLALAIILNLFVKGSHKTTIPEVEEAHGIFI